MYTTSAFLILVFSLNFSYSDAVKYKKEGGYKAVFNPYSTLTADKKKCEEKCDLDESCNGYSIDTFNDRCFLSSCDKFIDVRTCWTCLFARKVEPLSDVLCLPAFTTSTQETTISLSSTKADPTTIQNSMTQFTQFIALQLSFTVAQGSTSSFTEYAIATQSTTSKDSTTLMQSTSATLPLINKANNNTTNTLINNTSCICVCKYVNRTLDESLERRMKELVLNKNQLSSARRKLTSASDFRKSVEVIGSLAIEVFALFGLFFFCTDICSIMSRTMSTNA